MGYIDGTKNRKGGGANNRRRKGKEKGRAKKRRLGFGEISYIEESFSMAHLSTKPRKIPSLKEEMLVEGRKKLKNQGRAKLVILIVIPYPQLPVY